ncbi:arabinogalactan protein 41-like [Abrus precatorius]|uniref:Arabinogalactan protein 41-like n=1 Tax=Abrus precatorius TaxID=3816 RepID=A0A8B8M2A2_ABRPR|nr:arabinogalactan protein 41-like [Abrus precatorius]
MAAFTFSFRFGVVAVVASLIFTLYMPLAVHSQSLAPAPAPTSDGTSIDQGIAYVLMMLALALTYLIHSADLSSTF